MKKVFTVQQSFLSFSTSRDQRGCREPHQNPWAGKRKTESKLSPRSESVLSEHDFHTWGSLWACQTQPPQTSGQNPHKEFLQLPGEEPAPQWDPQTTFKGATKAQKWKCMLILEQQYRMINAGGGIRGVVGYKASPQICAGHGNPVHLKGQLKAQDGTQKHFNHVGAWKWAPLAHLLPGCNSVIYFHVLCALKRGYPAAQVHNKIHNTFV